MIFPRMAKFYIPSCSNEFHARFQDYKTERRRKKSIFVCACVCGHVCIIYKRCTREVNVSYPVHTNPEHNIISHGAKFIAISWKPQSIRFCSCCYYLVILWRYNKDKINLKCEWRESWMPKIINSICCVSLWFSICMNFMLHSNLKKIAIILLKTGTGDAKILFNSSCFVQW